MGKGLAQGLQSDALRVRQCAHDVLGPPDPALSIVGWVPLRMGGDVGSGLWCRLARCQSLGASFPMGGVPTPIAPGRMAFDGGAGPCP